MIKVLQIAGSAYGGVEHVIQNYYEHIDKTQVNFDIVYHGNRDAFVENMENLGCKVYVLKKPAQIGIYQYYKQICEILKKHDYTVIHVHPLQYIGIALLAAKHNGIKKRVAHIHSTYFRTKKIKNRVIYLYVRYSILKLATDIITCSRFAAQSYIGTKKEVPILYNAVDAEEYINSDKKFIDELKTQLGIKGKKVIGHVGNFVELKNHDFIMNIAESMLENTEYVFVLVGGGRLLKIIQNKAKERNLNNIIFLGYRNDVPKLLHMFDLLILPSLSEGLGIVVIEAQLAGIPTIVSTNVPKQVDLGLNIVFFLSLEETSRWKCAIQMECGINIPSISERLRRQKMCGYDIYQQANKLLKFYLKAGV